MGDGEFQGGGGIGGHPGFQYYAANPASDRRGKGAAGLKGCVEIRFGPFLHEITGNHILRTFSSSVFEKGYDEACGIGMQSDVG